MLELIVDEKLEPGYSDDIRGSGLEADVSEVCCEGADRVVVMAEPFARVGGWRCLKDDGESIFVVGAAGELDAFVEQ